MDFPLDSAIPCKIETQAPRSLFSSYDASAGGRDDRYGNNNNNNNNNSNNNNTHNNNSNSIKNHALPILTIPFSKGNIEYNEGEVKDILITLVNEAKLIDEYYPTSAQNKIDEVLDFRDNILYPAYLLAVEPILSDGLHTGKIESEYVANILDACNEIGTKFLNENGCGGQDGYVLLIQRLQILHCYQYCAELKLQNMLDGN